MQTSHLLEAAVQLIEIKLDNATGTDEVVDFDGDVRQEVSAPAVMDQQV